MAEGERTPPRLVYTHGQVLFWRPGAERWGPAQVNTPLAPGDLLYAAPGGTVELQVGARAFARAGGGRVGAELGLDSLEPDYLQFKLASGRLSLDVREFPRGGRLDVNTPDGVLAIERAGYYGIEAGPERTAFVVYRGGPATLTPEDGAQLAVRANEQVVSSGPENRVEFSGAPGLSDWDRWNLARTDALLPGGSAQYVPSSVYGVGDLDRHGSWRVVPEYGPVWTPAGVAPDWAPYSTGRWIWDPYFNWTWVDDAPWGWAPYHHGRWVQMGEYWAWAPGPAVEVPEYAPALVTFFHSVGVSRPISWVALGWGEPCVPWWGHSRFVGRPWWGGWGGPRVAHGHQNASVHRALITVPAEHFGREAVGVSRLRNIEVAGLRPVQGALEIRPTPRSLVPATGHTVRPTVFGRRDVLATRPPHDVTARLRAEGLVIPSAVTEAAPKTKLVGVLDRERRLAPAERRESDRLRKASETRENTGGPASKPRLPAPGPPSSPAPPARAIESRAPKAQPARPEPGHRLGGSPPPVWDRHAPVSQVTPTRIPPVGGAPAERVEQDGEAPRPALGQGAPTRKSSPVRLPAPAVLERGGAPRSVRQAPSGPREPAQPSIASPREDRRPVPAREVPRVAGPRKDRVAEHRPRAERRAPEGSSVPTPRRNAARPS
jgi:hypothetical protein